jgi:hypothetical protein
VESSCEHGNEISGSTKCMQILEYLREWQLLKKGSVELSYTFITKKPVKN